MNLQIKPQKPQKQIPRRTQARLETNLESLLYQKELGIDTRPTVRRINQLLNNKKHTNDDKTNKG